MARRQATVAAGHAEPCVWMSAGLVAYKLCDRDFNCDRCPLDAALRGEAGPNGGPTRVATETSWSFPADRSYSPGHLWTQPDPRAARLRHRVGLDAFAAALLGTCRRVRFSPLQDELEKGQVFCELELDIGTVPLTAPESGWLDASNEELARDPFPLLADPYGDGWLAEFRAATPPDDQSWACAPTARERARLDLRRFRRSIALRMLTEDVGRVLADGGQRITDLRQMVGAPAYLELLRRLIY